MAKSPVVIAVMGIGACAALSLLMQQALRARQESRVDPLQRDVERQFARQLVGGVSVREDQVDGRRQIAVEVAVIAGLRKEPIADAIGALVWEKSRETERVPDEVVVAVGDDGEGRILTRAVRRPLHLR